MERKLFSCRDGKNIENFFSEKKERFFLLIFLHFLGEKIKKKSLGWMCLTEWRRPAGG
jgi:hypothetical protein